MIIVVAKSLVILDLLVDQELNQKEKNTKFIRTRLVLLLYKEKSDGPDGHGLVQ